MSLSSIAAASSKWWMEWWGCHANQVGHSRTRYRHGTPVPVGQAVPHPQLPHPHTPPPATHLPRLRFPTLPRPFRHDHAPDLPVAGSTPHAPALLCRRTRHCGLDAGAEPACCALPAYAGATVSPLPLHILLRFTPPALRATTPILLPPYHGSTYLPRLNVFAVDRTLALYRAARCRLLAATPAVVWTGSFTTYCTRRTHLVRAANACTARAATADGRDHGYTLRTLHRTPPRCVDGLAAALLRTRLPAGSVRTVGLV